MWQGLFKYPLCYIWKWMWKYWEWKMCAWAHHCYCSLDNLCQFLLSNHPSGQRTWLFEFFQHHIQQVCSERKNEITHTTKCLNQERTLGIPHLRRGAAKSDRKLFFHQFPSSSSASMCGHDNSRECIITFAELLSTSRIWFPRTYYFK